jgi:hypothetical protein
VLVIALSAIGSAGHPVRTGALVLSRYTSQNKRNATAYGPYSVLRSIEDMLNDTALAHTARARSFAASVLR